jgi:hypothetical protein
VPQPNNCYNGMELLSPIISNGLEEVLRARLERKAKVQNSVLDVLLPF